MFTALANGETQMLLPDGAHFSLLEPRLQSLRELIEEARALADRPSQALRISRYQASLWAELAALGIVAEQAQGWQRQISALLELDSIAEHELPATLNAELRPYQARASTGSQRSGSSSSAASSPTTWASARRCRRSRSSATPASGIPASARSSSSRRRASSRAGSARPPASPPGSRVSAVADTLAKSGRTIGELADADIVVTTYTLLRLDAAAYRSVPWAGVILDEAQFVKNHQAMTYKCVRELAAPFKLAITGTPMENNLTELWSLLSITAPGLFPDPKRFAEEYARPIERGGDRRAARTAAAQDQAARQAANEGARRARPAGQAGAEPSRSTSIRATASSTTPTSSGSGRRSSGCSATSIATGSRSSARSPLLRQLSLHAGLADPDHETIPCAKLDALVEQLGDVIGSGHRALVFSQFTGFLAKARDDASTQPGSAYCYLDGRTRKRERVLDAFKNGTDPCS